jgi:hypothetical protein
MEDADERSPPVDPVPVNEQHQRRMPTLTTITLYNRVPNGLQGNDNRLVGSEPQGVNENQQVNGGVNGNTSGVVLNWAGNPINTTITLYGSRRNEEDHEVGTTATSTTSTTTAHSEDHTGHLEIDEKEM